jgi:hypothetical protein
MGTIFEADFQSAVDGAVTALADLDAGTQTGSWSGTQFANSLLDSDGTNRGALFEQDGVNLTADFSDAGVLATGVTVSFDAGLTRSKNSPNSRASVIKGIASDGTVLFALGIDGDAQLPDMGRLVYYATDFTPQTLQNNTPAKTTIGASDLFTKGTTTYDDTIMETIRLELTTTSFDVYINDVLATNGDDIAYFSGGAAAGNIAKLNFQSDYNGGAWYDNLSAAAPTNNQKIPEYQNELNTRNTLWP